MRWEKTLNCGTGSPSDFLHDFFNFIWPLISCSKIRITFKDVQITCQNENTT